MYPLVLLHYCHHLIHFRFHFHHTKQALVTITLITVLTNTDAWRKRRLLWSFIIVYCDSLDFVDFLSVLAKFIMLNVFVQLGDFQSVKLLLLYKCFPVSNVRLSTLELAFLFSALAYASHWHFAIATSAQCNSSPVFLSTMNLEENSVIASLNWIMNSVIHYWNQ